MSRLVEAKGKRIIEDVVDEEAGLSVPFVVTKPTLSPTALGAYEICLRRGQYYHDPDIPPGPPTLAQVEGTAWHRAMEYVNVLMRDNKPGWDPVSDPNMVDFMYDVMQGSLIQTMEDTEVIVEEGEDPAGSLIRFVAILDRWSTGPPHDRWVHPKVEVIGVERQLYLEDGFGDGTHAFNGYADAILRIEDLGNVGVDYKKTGRAWGGAKAAGDPRKLIQAPLYAEAWEAETGEAMDWFVYDVMTNVGKFQRVWVPTSAEVRAPIIDRWREMSELINVYQDRGDFPTNPGHILCSAKWCGFWEVCPMGSAFDEKMNTVPFMGSS